VEGEHSADQVAPRPKPASFDRAEDELQRLDLHDRGQLVERLRHGDVEMVPAAQLVRQMTGRALPAVSEHRVQHQIRRIQARKRLRPVLAVGDVLVDGEHRVAAVNHLDPTAPVAVVNVTKKGATMPKKANIAKSSSTSPSNRAAIGRMADELTALGRNDPAVMGLATTLRDSLAGGVDHAPAQQPTMVTKSERNRNELMAEMAENAADDSLSPDPRQRLRDPLRKLQGEYLARASPAGHGAWEAARQHAPIVAGRQLGRIAKIEGDGDDLRAKAQKIDKADPSLTPYEALEHAYREARVA
jgi:hypothetical protein